MKIVVLDGHTLNPGDLSWDRINKMGDCTVYERTPASLVVERAKDATAIFTNKVILDAGVLAQLAKLKFIGVLATGFNVVDVQAARNAGIVVSNIPAYSTASVAQMVFAHILHFTQHVATHATSVSNDDWARSIDFSMHIDKEENPAGDRVVVTMNGKFLPYKSW